MRNRSNLSAPGNSVEGLSRAGLKGTASEILREHLEVTRLTTTYKLRSLHEVGFWEDFEGTGEDLETAAVREMTELQMIAVEIDAPYASDDIAPPHWQDKIAFRKQLRNRVRKLVYPLGGVVWKKTRTQVDEYAVRHYAKV